MLLREKLQESRRPHRLPSFSWMNEKIAPRKNAQMAINASAPEGAAGTQGIGCHGS
jgi:hypothetical protein